MPIYPYACLKCEKLHTFIGKYEDIKSKEASFTCSDPGCKGSLKRKVASSSFKLSGSGWFSDGYK